jgi:hypothetical protein
MGGLLACCCEVWYELPQPGTDSSQPDCIFMQYWFVPYGLRLTADDKLQVLGVATGCSPTVVPLCLVSAPALCLALAEG